MQARQSRASRESERPDRHLVLDHAPSVFRSPRKRRVRARGLQETRRFWPNCRPGPLAWRFLKQALRGVLPPSLILLCSLTLNGAALDDPFAVVFIDHKTEETYGGFPLDRAILAKGIREIKKHKPRGIIIKFFLDLPKDPASDRALADSFNGVPVILEARLEDSVAKPNLLPHRFVLKTPLTRRNTALSGQSGWLPLEMFSAKAAD